MPRHFRSFMVGLRIVVPVITTIIIIAAFPFNRALLYTLLVSGQYPPLYPTYHSNELELPHYKAYEHSGVKYIWSPNHPWGIWSSWLSVLTHADMFCIEVGWGNIMQDYILNYVLAYATNRSFVFDDYTWAVDGTPYSEFNGKLIPSRIPLSALIDGPLAGGQLPPADSTPRAVYKDFFHRVCPNPTILRLSDVSGWSNLDTVEFVLNKWAEKINSIEDPCLQFEETGPDEQIFNVMVYSRKDLLSIWPYMSRLPMLLRWGWSSLIHDAVEANLDTIFPHALSWPYRQDLRGNDTMAELLVIHVRRGDFTGHCKFLASWNSDWNAFNSFPELPDKYNQATSDPRLSPENKQAYMDHCYPSTEQIVEKVRIVREESHKPLKYLYIMTNGDDWWVKNLKTALYDIGGWEHIGSNRDLHLTWEQKYVAQAVDMLIAQKAEVFIGNGWSSLSSNIVMLRTVDGLPPGSNRFW